jgi:leucyl-tRNA synthetase
MYGQTNVFLLPEGIYGIYRLKNGEVYICSSRSALNMSYQGMFTERGRPTLLGEVKGQELMGCAVQAPLASYAKVYVLPLLTIKMTKGTGVVTSVPSDAPDDYAALMDLKKKAALRDKFGIKEEMVLPYDPVPIIDVEGLGTLSAVDLCIKYKVNSQNDTTILTMIKETVYMDAFYKGRMIVGEHKGAKVSDAKPLIKQYLIDRNEAASYSEPESVIMSRSGNECVVALTDQWYLVYGETEWKAQVKKHVDNTLETYNPAAHKRFVEVTIISNHAIIPHHHYHYHYHSYYANMT